MNLWQRLVRLCLPNKVQLGQSGEITKPVFSKHFSAVRYLTVRYKAVEITSHKLVWNGWKPSLLAHTVLMWDLHMTAQRRVGKELQYRMLIEGNLDNAILFGSHRLLQLALQQSLHGEQSMALAS